MPILPPEYISSWYYFKDDANFIRIFESWDETQEQEVDKVALLQGDIGTRAMNVGGIKWVTSIQSPALIVETLVETQEKEDVTDAFDLLVYAFNQIRDPALTQSVSQDPTISSADKDGDYLLRDANIKVAQEGVDITMSIVSSRPGAFAATSNIGGSLDFIARVARFYDVLFVTSDDTQIYSYQVLSANINIKVNITDNYFINKSSQAPYFGVQGYHVSGELELAVPPGYYPDIFIAPQNDGVDALNVNNTSVSIILTGHDNGLILGSTQIRSRVKRSLNPNNISTVTVSFETFTRYTTPAVGA